MFDGDSMNCVSGWQIPEFMELPGDVPMCWGDFYWRRLVLADVRNPYPWVSCGPAEA